MLHKAYCTCNVELLFIYYAYMRAVPRLESLAIVTYYCWDSKLNSTTAITDFNTSFIFFCTLSALHQ